MADWQEKFGELTSKIHSDQAKWWLNGFWEEGGKEAADQVWDICHSFIELDVGFPILYGRRMREYKESPDLDEMQSHVILEKLGETMTVMALRKRLKDLDIDNNKRMALSEYLLDKYGKKPADLVNSPQGTVDPEDMRRAQEEMDRASDALDQASADAEAAKIALDAAQKAAAAAAEALATQEAAEAEVKKAEDELKEAVAELDRVEAEYQGKIKKFEDMIADEGLSAMKKARANNELAQLKSEDPLPLRKAKITQGAALKRVSKQKKKAEAATAACLAIKADADAAEAASIEAKATAEAAAKAAAEAVAAAEATLNKLKSAGTGTPQGNIYWMEKTLIEKKKFL